MGWSSSSLMTLPYSFLVVDAEIQVGIDHGQQFGPGLGRPLERGPVRRRGGEEAGIAGQGQLVDAR